MTPWPNQCSWNAGRLSILIRELSQVVINLRRPKSVTAILISSPQFQYTHGNLNELWAISTCSRQFQFTHMSAELVKQIPAELARKVRSV